MAVKSSKTLKVKNPGPKYDYLNQLLLVVIAATVTTFPFIFDSFTVSKLFVLAIGLTLLSIRIFLEKNSASFAKIPKLLAIMIGLLLLSMICAWTASGVPFTRGLIGQFGRGNGFLYYFFVMLIFALTVKTFKSSSGRRMHELLTILSWLMAAYAALQRAGIDIAKLDTGGISPVVLTFGNSNFAGGMLSVLFAYQLTYTVISRSYRVQQIGLLLALALGSAFATAVQGYLIILFSLIFVSSISLVNKYPSLWVRRSLIVAWSLGLISAILGIFGKFVFAGIFSRGSFRIRVEYWNIALNVIRDFPFFGVGPDKLYDVTSAYMAPGTIKIITTTRLDNAHNWYLNFGANYGLISLLFLLAIFGWVFFAGAHLLKSLTQSNAVALSSTVAFVAMFIDGLVSIEQPGIGVWLYFFAGVTVGASLQSQVKNTDKTSVLNSKSAQSPSLTRVISILFLFILSLSSLVLGNRIVFDGILRSNVQTALLNKGTPQTFSAIESASLKLHSDPEYASQALRPLAAIGDGVKLNVVSQAFYDYYPESIQATLIRADVLRALNRVGESCPLRTTLVKNMPWDFGQVTKYIDCHMEGYEDPAIVKILLNSARYFSEFDRTVIPADVNEASKTSQRLQDVATRARISLITGKYQEARSTQSYGKALLFRLIELRQLNPTLVPESQIDYFRKLLDFN